jgi:membrane protein YqaA with SNARE-associated domain
MILEFFRWLLNSYGLVGIFLVSLIGSSTIILPLPSAAIIFLAGSIMNPLLVGALGGLGSTIGEFSGYILGQGGRKAIERKWKKEIDKIEKLFEKYGGFLVTVAFAATPLPDDIVGLFCGVINYNVKKFFFAVLIGKLIMNLALAYGGFYGIRWILDVFSSIS